MGSLLVCGRLLRGIGQWKSGVDIGQANRALAVESGRGQKSSRPFERLPW
jgi:hypothetical protein